MDSLEILCGIAVVFLALYFYFTAKFNFWKDRGINGPKPIPVFGNIKDVMFGKSSLGDLLAEFYKIYGKEPAIGVFARRTPVLVVHDLDMIKDILIKDFSTFADRGMSVHEKTDPLSPHLFSLEPKRWRPLRKRLSPIFTSGKLKGMFSLILECSKHLEDHLKVLVEKGEDVDCHQLTTKFTIDIIGTCVFGIEINSLADDDSEFPRIGGKVFEPSFRQFLEVTIKESMPWLYHFLGYILPPTEITKFFTNFAKEMIDYRVKNNIVRHDFVNTLVDLQQNPDKLGDIEVTDTLLAAQAFIFFGGGFETSSTTMTQALYELALNQDVQRKLRKEINEHYEKSEGNLLYEDLKKLTYLDGVFRETLRKYPSGTVLLRKAITDYTFRSRKLSIQKGTKIWIPIYAIQRDPIHYPNPDAFQPERFTKEATAARHSMTFLPFGDGPRACIGARFAAYQSKIGLIKILRKYKVDVCKKTPIPYENHPLSLLLAPKKKIYLKLTKL